MAQTVKNLLAMQETQIRSLGREDPLVEEMATHSSILLGGSHEQRSLAGHSPWGRKVFTEQLTLSLSLFGETGEETRRQHNAQDRKHRK